MLFHKHANMVSGLLLAIYILGRMFADYFLWRQISEYYSYLFELIFVFVSYWYFRSSIRLFRAATKSDFFWIIGGFIAGTSVYLLMPISGVQNPFDLSSYATLFLLLFFAPLLEELIFRMALWEQIKYLCKNILLTLILTTLLFSISHFLAFFYVPPQFKGFVIYQSFYVLFLGLALGLRRWKADCLSSCLWLHIAFNSGFLLASTFR